MHRFTTLIASAVFTGLSCGVATAAGGPPTEGGWYVSLDACPFECCTYRDWVAESDTVLYEGARSSEEVGTIRAGQTVVALTGDVYVTPVPVEVIHEATVDETSTGRPFHFNVGETLYLLDYLSEGYQRVWRAGDATKFDIHYMWPPEGILSLRQVSYRSCSTPSDICWWRIAPKHLPQYTEWWVWLRLPDGATGWISSPENFDNKSRCD